MDGQTENEVKARPGNGGGSAFEGRTVVNDDKGRFRGAGGMTGKQRAFVTAYLANGCRVALAARSAGYAFPEVEGFKLLHKDCVKVAIREGRDLLLSGEMASLAFTSLKNLMIDETVPAAVKFQAAKFVIEANGYGLSAQVAKAKLSVDTSDKPLSEYTAVELRDLVAAQTAAVEALRSVSAPIIEAEVVQQANDERLMG